MKEAFKEEIELSKQLNQYTVDIPKYKLNKKLTMYERFIRYLASPTKDPLEQITTSSSGFLFFKILPLVCGIVLAVLQGILH